MSVLLTDEVLRVAVDRLNELARTASPYAVAGAVLEAAHDAIATEGRPQVETIVRHSLKPWVRPDTLEVAVNAVITDLLGDRA